MRFAAKPMKANRSATSTTASKKESVNYKEHLKDEHKADQRGKCSYKR